jgi:hypothetical protein
VPLPAEFLPDHLVSTKFNKTNRWFEIPFWSSNFARSSFLYLMFPPKGGLLLEVNNINKVGPFYFYALFNRVTLVGSRRWHVHDTQF